MTVPWAQSARAGTSMVETLVALLLTLALTALLARLAADHRAASQQLARRMEILEARRVARDLVGRALAGDLPGAAGGEGELELRHPVGRARACPGGGWLYRGRRRPDPERDSLWTVSLHGSVRVVGLAAVRGSSCSDAPPGEEALELVPDTLLPPLVLVRVFERGRFRVSDAVRYGRTGTPPQPLTAAVLDPRGSWLERSPGGIVLRVRGEGDTATVQRIWRFP